MTEGELPESYVTSVPKIVDGPTSYPRTEINRELLEWARKNLKNIPDDETYARMISGMPYDTFSPKYIGLGMITADKVREHRDIKAETYESEAMEAALWRKLQLLKEIFGHTEELLWVAGTFNVDFGFNVSVGERFYANFNVTFLDSAPIIFGDDINIGPNSTFVTATHPTTPEDRAKKVVYAFPILVKDRVWIGANVTVLPGVTIGEDSTIAAGAVVRNDVPPRSIVGGIPARVLRTLEPKSERSSEGPGQEEAGSNSLDSIATFDKLLAQVKGVEGTASTAAAL